TTPTRSTLFPYTTLFRSKNLSRQFHLLISRPSHSGSGLLSASSRLRIRCIAGRSGGRSRAIENLICEPRGHRMQRCNHSSFCLRSEEHTSELQSRGHLVC